jgi:hypothetical protein
VLVSVVSYRLLCGMGLVVKERGRLLREQEQEAA